jgi:hypothetical protein
MTGRPFRERNAAKLIELRSVPQQFPIVLLSLANAPSYPVFGHEVIVVGNDRRSGGIVQEVCYWL